MANMSTAASPPQPHDHRACIATLLDRARGAFDAQGLKLTTLRLRVLERIAASHDAIGAYDIIERVAETTGERLAPISVYRAVDALQQAGLVHRLESRNAYFACHAPHEDQQRHMALVCDLCDRVVEVPAVDLYAAIAEASRTAGFNLRNAIAEGSGVCAHCRAPEVRR